METKADYFQPAYKRGLLLQPHKVGKLVFLCFHPTQPTSLPAWLQLNSWQSFSFFVQFLQSLH